MLSDVNGAKSLTSVKLSSLNLNITKPCLTTEVFPDVGNTRTWKGRIIGTPL